jgi:hypothetical protein
MFTHFWVLDGGSPEGIRIAEYLSQANNSGALINSTLGRFQAMEISLGKPEL